MKQSFAKILAIIFHWWNYLLSVIIAIERCSHPSTNDGRYPFVTSLSTMLASTVESSGGSGAVNCRIIALNNNNNDLQGDKYNRDYVRPRFDINN